MNVSLEGDVSPSKSLKKSNFLDDSAKINLLWKKTEQFQKMKKMKEQKSIRFNSRKKGIIIPNVEDKKPVETDKTKIDNIHNDEVSKFLHP